MNTPGSPGASLERISPALAASIAWTRLGEFPTRCESAETLAGHLDIGQVLVKRDDQSCNIYGGNKVRKLEFLLADALASGAGAVLTFGGAGSNHAIATSVHASRLGLPCYAVLTQQAPSPTVARTLRYHCHVGTHVVFGGDSFKTQRPAAEEVMASWKGNKPLYEIAMGGTDNIGMLGYVLAAYELAEQVRTSAVPTPTRIYAPCGTMGTVVGLALGLRMAGLDCTVVGVRVVNFTLAGPDRAQRLVDETMRWIQSIDPDVATPDSVVDSIEFRDEQFGDGYAIPTPASQKAAEIAREHAGLMLDQTYSGKAFAALVRDAREGRLEGETPLFWNTYNSAPYPANLSDVDTSTLPEQLKVYLGD